MIMNKKGFTMIELMVSISIIAIVMVFLVQLLVNIRYDKLNELYDTANQINRAEIIKTVEADFTSNHNTEDSDTSLTDLVEVNAVGSTADKLILNLTRNDTKTATITVDKDHFSYIDIDGKSHKWALKKNNPLSYYKIQDIKLNKIADKNSTNDYTFVLEIPVIADPDKTKDKATGGADNPNEYDNKQDNLIFYFSSYNGNAKITATSTNFNPLAQ